MKIQNKPPPNKKDQKQKVKSFAQLLPANVVVRSKHFPELSARGEIKNPCGI
jgi:hypothetical protein